MAEKIKKISVNELDKIIGAAEKYTDIQWNGLNVRVKRRLSIGEVMSFVDTVYDICMHNWTGGYMPELKDFAIKSCTIAMYTNITLPKNGEKQYDYICALSDDEDSLFDEIDTVIDVVQYDNMMDAINEKIKLGVRTGVEDISAKISDVCNVIESMQSQIDNVFNGVTPEQLTSFMSAMKFAEGNPDALMKAIVEDAKNG